MAPDPIPQGEQVLNQSPAFTDVNLFTSDTPLREAVAREGAADAAENLAAFGRIAGSAAAAELGRQANEHSPRLRAFDAQGRRLDRVDYHPAYHRLMGFSTAQGLHCSTWEYLARGSYPQPGAHVARCAGSYMAAQMEAGHCCPITMTHAAVATLRHEPVLLRSVLPKLVARSYDPRFAPWQKKQAITIGMGMTERQGGTDVRTNTTVAKPLSGNGGGKAYAISGHKWFLSAPMSDAFLVLAQAKGGLSCFFMPRFSSDGSVNRLQDRAAQGQARQSLQRLGRGDLRQGGRLSHQRGGERRPHHHRHGDADAARLRRVLGGADAASARPCAPSRAASHRVPEEADRSAADAPGACRHGARCRGRDRAHLQARRSLRRPRRSGRDRLSPPDDFRSRNIGCARSRRR